MGHFYAGLRRRAFGWLFAVGVIMLGAALAVPALAYASAFRWALLALLAGYALSWVGPLIDLWIVPQSRFSRVPLWQVLTYALAVPFAWALLGVSLRTWIVEAFEFPSSSMAPTLLVGDHIFVDKLESGRAERGIVIVFQHPERAHEDFGKRVVGMPGDLVEMKQGRLWLNGWEVPHCVLGRSSVQAEDEASPGTVVMEFLEGRAYLTFSEEDRAEPFDGSWKVAPGECFVLGDFRTNSSDSRAWFGGRSGGVPFENVKGRGLGIWLGLQGPEVDLSRSGMSLFAPALPRSMQHLKHELERCLRERPRDAATLPPSAPR